MSSNAKFREMGPFSLKMDIKTLGTTFDLIKNAAESFWKFGLLALRPFLPLAFAALLKNCQCKRVSNRRLYAKFHVNWSTNDRFISIFMIKPWPFIQ